jgi:hypothetical protein
VLQPGKLSDVSNMWETYFKTPEKLVTIILF